MGAAGGMAGTCLAANASERSGGPGMKPGTFAAKKTLDTFPGDAMQGKMVDVEHVAKVRQVREVDPTS